MTKAFGGARALVGVNLTVEAGTVHALLGENGSGKSTLIKILAGYHSPDAGEIYLGGHRLHGGRRHRVAGTPGLQFVHQDLGLIPTLSVLENFRMGIFPASPRRFHISWRRERRAVRALFAAHGLDVRLSTLVRDLPPVQQALLAITRAVSGLDAGRGNDGEDYPGGLLVLDEPTVYLPQASVDELFRVLRSITKTGVAVLFVSHRLGEVLAIADVVTVLRDGVDVATVQRNAVDKVQLVELIIGGAPEGLADAGGTRATEDTTSEADVHGAGVRVEALAGGATADVAFAIAPGEILGLTGLLGTGFEDVPYLLSGARRARCGHLRVGSTSLDLSRITPKKALRAGIVLVPGDRVNEGVIATLTLRDNMMVPVLDRFSSLRLLLHVRRLSQASLGLARRFGVRPPRPKMLFAGLSGGNQQKALMAKWLQTSPLLLCLHEPTQGVDVGARTQLFRLIREAADGGSAVLMASSDFEQLAACCDRVAVFARGRIAAELSGDEINEERLAQMSYASA